MAKKPQILNFTDIVLSADSETIRQALEARVQIDKLLVERLEAYQKIAALETEVEEILGDTGVYPFPAPPVPIAGLDGKGNPVTRAKAKAKAAAPKKAEPEPAMAEPEASLPEEAVEPAADEAVTANEESEAQEEEKPSAES